MCDSHEIRGNDMDMKATAQRYMQLLNEYEAVRGAWADMQAGTPADKIAELEGEMNQLRAQVIYTGETLANMVLRDGY